MDYYQLLEIDKNANIDEIKKSYRTLAKKYHPDKNKNTDSQKFKDITKAYEVLSNSVKREEYDRYGTTIPQNENSPFEMFMNFNQFENLFQQPIIPNKKKNNDIVLSISVTLEELYTGCSKKIEWTSQTINEKRECQKCYGKGSTMIEKILGPGIITQGYHICLDCQGVGNLFTYLENTHNQYLHIPPGCLEKKLTFTGLGNQFDNSSPRGNLHINLDVSTHSKFKQFKHHLSIDHTIPLKRSLLGGDIYIPTLTKNSILLSIDKIEPETFRVIHNGGMPHPVENPVLNHNQTIDFQKNSNYGDLIVYFHVKYPVLDKTRIDLLQKIIPMEIEDVPENLVELPSISLTTEQNKKLFKSLYETKNITSNTSTKNEIPLNNPSCPVQ